MLGKGVYPYEDIDDWQRFNKAILPEKEDYYGHLNMDNITDAKRNCKNFKIKKLEQYLDLYVRSDTLLLAGVLEDVRNMWDSYWKISFSSWISTASNFKKDQRKIRFFN